MPLVEQELPTLPEHPSSSPVFSRVRVTRSLVLYVCFVDGCLSIAIVSVLLRFTDSNYAFGSFKLFLTNLLIIKLDISHLINILMIED